MRIPVKIDSDFELLSEGIHPAILADVVDLGERDTQNGPKLKVQFVWLTSEVDTEGRTKRAFETFNQSVHERSRLGQTVRKLGAVVPSSGFYDPEDLIGTQRNLVIQHNEAADGKVYANITAYLKPDGKSPKMSIPRDFERKGKAPARTAVATPQAAPKPSPAYAGNQQPISDEDVPF